MEGHASAVLSYINFCTETVVETKTVKVFPNQKFRERDSAFNSGTQLEYREAQKRLRKGIREAKRRYKQRIEEHFNTNSSKYMWQGIKTLTGYKTSRAAPDPMDSSLANTLNQFFARFDQQNAETNC